MASGRTHDIVNLMALPPIVYYLKPSDYIGFSTGYLVGTFFLTPDNDIYHSLPNKRWKILRFLWKPYTKIFSHRGISHYPIIGTVTRLVYLITVFLILFSIFYFILINAYPESKKFFSQIMIDYSYLSSPFFISFLIGLFLSEIIHILTDVVYSFFKKINPKRIL